MQRVVGNVILNTAKDFSLQRLVQRTTITLDTSWGLVLALRVKVNLIHQLLPNKTVTATAVDAEKESSLENQSRLTLELSSFRDGSVRGSGLPRGYTQHKTSSTSSVKLSSASSGLMLAEESCASPEYDV